MHTHPKQSTLPITHTSIPLIQPNRHSFTQPFQHTNSSFRPTLSSKNHHTVTLKVRIKNHRHYHANKTKQQLFKYYLSHSPLLLPLPPPPSLITARINCLYYKLLLLTKTKTKDDTFPHIYTMCHL